MTLASSATVDELAAGGRLTIDLAALCANYALLAARAAPARTRRGGQGRRLWPGRRRGRAGAGRGGCRDFFVAHLAEARRAARRARRRRRNLRPERHPARRRAHAARRRAPCRCSTASSRSKPGASAASTPAGRLPAALQVDSGMSRLGLPPADVEALAAMPRAFDGHRGRAGDEPSRLRRRAGPSGQRGAARRVRDAARAFCRRRRRRSPIRRACFLGRRIPFRSRPARRRALRRQPDAGTAQPDAAGGRARRAR